MNVAIEPALGKPAQETPFATSVASFASAVRVSFALSNASAAAAPLMSTLALNATVASKLLPILPRGLIVVDDGETKRLVPTTAEAVGDTMLARARTPIKASVNVRRAPRRARTPWVMIGASSMGS